jgi:raffinose synthase
VPGLEGERFACYAVRAGRLDLLGPGDAVSFSLDEAQFELFWLAPIERGFAPLGLADKLNGPQALVALDWHPDGACSLRVGDGGVFLAYSQRAPSRVTEGDAVSPGAALAFAHDLASGDAGRGLLRVELGSARSFTVSW